MPAIVERSVTFKTPAVFEPLLQPSRYKGAYGGRGGAKSHFFAENLIERCLMNPGTRAVCAREVQKSLAQSVKLLLEDKIRKNRLEHLFPIKNTHIETPGGGLIIFSGMQAHTVDSIKSLEGFDIAWVEEAQTLSQKSLTMLRPTIRAPHSELWFSWNPSQPTDPVDAFFRKELPPDAILVKSNWYDNPFFPEELRIDMEWDRARDMDKYQHVWEGEYEKNSEFRVFKNWVVEDFDTPDDAAFLFGADWGYSIDPAVMVRMFIQGRKLYIDHEAYKIGVEIDHLPAHFDQVPGAREWVSVADSSRPDTISYLKRHGYPKMQPSQKGSNSVKEGITFLQSYDIVVHPRCVHTIDELKSYKYKKHPLTGEPTPELEDKKNHVIDSLRYAVERVRKRTAGGVLAGKATW